MKKRSISSRKREGKDDLVRIYKKIKENPRRKNECESMSSKGS
jgi:hypothetical protein